jgi:type VI secretion system Hcp family effector
MSKFLDIPNIKGESLSPNPNWNQKIVLKDMSYHVTQEVAKRGGGSNVSQANFGNMHITKSMDCSSPLLAALLVGNSPLPTVTIRVSRDGANTTGAFAGQYEAETYTLTNVRFVSYQTSGHPGVTGLPQESLTLTFSAITERYQTVDQAGNLQSPQTGGFDIAGGQATAS